MVTEISNYSSSEVSLASDTEYVSERPRAAQGLSSIPDTMQSLKQAPKPIFLKRVFLNLTLLLVHFSTWTIQTWNWIVKHVFGYASRQKTLYSQLYHIAKKGDAEEITTFLKKNATESSAAGFLFGEFLSLPETYPHLAEILKGANVCLSQDRGFFFNRWKEHPAAYQRLSSHRYQNDECYAVGHFLFWLDLEGNTRFQFEKSPFFGFVNWVYHLVDYLRYKRDNEQQGVAGVSAHTEHYCISLEVDPAHFIFQKVSALNRR